MDHELRKAGTSRVQRLLSGWSANLTQVALGITQQLALVPIFLHYLSSDLFAAWLALYATSNLALAADIGLQSRAINRFLSFKSCVDADGRTAQYFGAMRWVYFALIGSLILLALAGTLLIRPSHVLGFHAISNFDVSFAVMLVGTLALLPSNLVSGLYRTRGLYGRAVWIQCAAMLLSQLAQVVAIVAIKNLTAIAIAYIAPQILGAIYVYHFDVYRQSPFLNRLKRKSRPRLRWTAGQFRRAFPFAIAGGTEVALQNLPVLIVSAIVADRIAVAQWGLTRIVAGLVRNLCLQATLPIAAELGHDRAIGAKDALRRLYARGSVLVTLMASVVVSAMLAFWPDFFALWTHGLIPYDPLLMLTLLIGAQLVAPSMLSLSFALYSDRGELLARSKGLQLVVFVVLSLALTPLMGALGTAIAIVATDLLIQFGLVALTIISETLERPARHIAFLFGLMIAVSAFGWGVGYLIRSVLPLTGLAGFVVECALWLIVMALVASPLLRRKRRAKLAEIIPA
jgi:O-antigen/teichoic acid export membrane protein